MNALWPRLAAVGLLLTATEASAQRMYVSSFQSGRLTAIDLEKGKALYSIRVEDGSGIIGVAVTPDGRTLLVVDGGSASRVRSFDASSGKMILARPFRERAAQLGGPAVVSISSDGRWLFIKTRAHDGPMGGIAVFDVLKGVLRPSEKQLEGCPWPELAGSPEKTWVAICPGAAMELERFTPGGAAFLAARRIPLPEMDVAGVALTPDGQSLYILPFPNQQSGWRLIEWRVGEKELVDHALPQFGSGESAMGRQAWLAMSEDGSLLGIAGGARAVVLNRQTMAEVQNVQLPGPSQQAMFTPDGRTLVTVNAGESEAWLVSISSGAVTARRFAAPRFGAGPLVMRLSVEPRPPAVCCP